MINTVYRLVYPKYFEEVFKEIDIKDKVVIRPTHMSICKADQRYYQGKRSAEILNEKLPMALIHEAIGEVIKDRSGKFKTGDKVVLIPNIPFDEDEIIKENYLKSSKFKSSGIDGFMSDFIVMPSDRVLKIPEDANLNVYSFTELVSVSFHAIDRFNDYSHSKKEAIGIWGDGNLSYITSLLLKTLYPETKLYVFGKTFEKLNMFSFVDETYKINEIPNDLSIDHGFECVGSSNSQDAIGQIIDLINPQGTIALLGVSEYPVAINTRLILEKGLNVFGTSRSGKEDFEEVLKLFEKHPKILSYLDNLISNIIAIESLNDMNKAFNEDFSSNFGKTILLWEK